MAHLVTRLTRPSKTRGTEKVVLVDARLVIFSALLIPVSLLWHWSNIELSWIAEAYFLDLRQVCEIAEARPLKDFNWFSRLYKVWTYELFENPVRPEDAWDADRARFLVDQQYPPDFPKDLIDRLKPPDATMGPEIESE